MVRVAIDKQSSPVERVFLVAELWSLKPRLGPFESKVILGKNPLVSGPVGPDARGGVGHKPLRKYVLSMEYGPIYLSPEITQTLGL